MTRTSFADGPNLRPLARAWGLPRAGALGAARTNVGALGALFARLQPELDTNRARYDRRPRSSWDVANPRICPAALRATCRGRNANGFPGRCESANLSRLLTRRTFANGYACGAKTPRPPSRVGVWFTEASRRSLGASAFTRATGRATASSSTRWTTRASASSATSTTRSNWPCSRRGSSPGGGERLRLASLPLP